MTAAQAVRRAKPYAKKPFNLVDTVQETDDFFIVSFRDKDYTDMGGGMIPLLFAVSKETGNVRPMFPPDPVDLGLLRKAKEVQL